jgi:hypothetical protein
MVQSSSIPASSCKLPCKFSTKYYLSSYFFSKEWYIVQRILFTYHHKIIYHLVIGQLASSLRQYNMCFLQNSTFKVWIKDNTVLHSYRLLYLYVWETERCFTSMISPLRWSQQGPPKHWYPMTLHRITNQKVLILMFFCFIFMILAHYILME